MKSTGREASTMSGFFSFSPNSSTSSSTGLQSSSGLASSLKTASTTVTTTNTASKTLSFPAFGVTSSSSTTTATGSVPIFANPTTGATSTGTSTSFLGLQTSSKTVAAATTPASSLFGEVTNEPQPAETSPPLAATRTPQKEWMVFRVVVPMLKIESFTGRNGDLIKKMCQETKAHIHVLEGPVCDTDTGRIVLIFGKEELEASLSPAMDAVIRVFKHVNGFPENESDSLASIPFCSIRLLVPSLQATSLIEKQGSLINKIQVLDTGCSVRILSYVPASSANSDDRVVDFHGNSLKVLQALEVVLGHLRKFLVDHSLLPLFEKTTGNDKDLFERRPGFFPTEPAPLTGQPSIHRSKSRRRRRGRSIIRIKSCRGLGAAAATSPLESLPPHVTAAPSGEAAGPLVLPLAATSVTQVEPHERESEVAEPQKHNATATQAKHQVVTWAENFIVRTDTHPQRESLFLDSGPHQESEFYSSGPSYFGLNPRLSTRPLHGFDRAAGPSVNPAMNGPGRGFFGPVRPVVLNTPTFHSSDQIAPGFSQNGVDQALTGPGPAKKVHCPTLLLPHIAVGPSDETSLEPQVPPSAPSLPVTQTKKEKMVEVPPELSQVQPAAAASVAIETNRTMSVFEEEVLGVLRMIADKMSKPEPPSKPTFEDCEKKLNELGWPKDDPLHDVAFAIFCNKNDKYRECWMKLKPERCANWVRIIGRSERFL